MDKINSKGKVVIVGASGMIGGIVLRECLSSNLVDNVVVIVRRSLGINHEKLDEVIHEDFTDYTGLEAQFSNCQAGFFCIGVYTGQVPDKEFKMITVDVAAAFGNMLKKYSPDSTLCFLSGQGADQNEKSRMSFARYKGMAENLLIANQFDQLYIFRPAYIYPVTPRKEPNISYRIFRALYPILKKVYPKGAITSEQLGKAMFHAGMKGTTKTVLENEDIKLVGQ